MDDGRVNSLYPERIIPSETESGPLAAHLVRYRFALRYTEGKEVLDAACGVGYGSAYLAENASRVLGVDVAQDAVDYATRNYGSETASFEVMDVEKLSFADASFDVVCSFETIEHLDDPESFVRECRRVLRPNGVFLVSTPKVAMTDRSPANPYHRVEFSQADFETLLCGSFSSVEIFGQTRRQSRLHRLLRRLDFLGLRRKLSPRLRDGMAGITKTTPWETSGINDFVIGPELRGASELIALCRP